MNKKTIITVEHTESEHHLNGHVGAWGDWPLTGNGRKQAMLMGFEFDDLRKAGFSGRSGSISGFTIGPDGRTTADYINFRLDI